MPDLALLSGFAQLPGNMDANQVLYLLIGIALLVMGRKLFWLFVAGVGFFAAQYFMPPYIPSDPAWLLPLISIIIGIFGAFLAVFAQHIAIGLGGFLAGGFLAMDAFEKFSWLDFASLASLIPTEELYVQVAVFVVAGIVGMLVVAFIFDWALLLLSSLLGAAMIMESFTVNNTVYPFLFAGLFVLGVILQAGLLQRDRKRGHKPAENK